MALGLEPSELIPGKKKGTNKAPNGGASLAQGSGMLTSRL